MNLSPKAEAKVVALAYMSDHPSIPQNPAAGACDALIEAANVWFQSRKKLWKEMIADAWFHVFVDTGLLVSRYPDEYADTSTWSSLWLDGCLSLADDGELQVGPKDEAFVARVAMADNRAVHVEVRSHQPQFVCTATVPSLQIFAEILHDQVSAHMKYLQPDLRELSLVVSEVSRMMVEILDSILSCEDVADTASMPLGHFGSVPPVIER